MPLVFINYRGADEPWVANWLCSALAARLGSAEVFLDSRSIPVGEDYARLLLNKVRTCGVLLVVIGSDWYASGPAGRLVDDQDDWVRREIATALAEGVRVIPLLVGDTPELVPDDLPPDIRPLAGLQCLRLRPRDAHVDIPRVVDDILAIEQGPTTREDLDRLLRAILPAVQQRLGNRGLLVDVAWALLQPDEQPKYLAPCRFSGRTPGSAVLLATDRRICVADLDHDNHVRQVLRIALGEITGVELHRHRRVGIVATADLTFHTAGGNRVLVRGLFRAQAEKMIDIVTGPPLSGRDIRETGS